MRISAAQIDITLGDVEANVAQIAHWTGRARDAGADLVVFPECALTGYCFDSREEALPHGRTVSDPLWERIAQACGAPREGASPCWAVVGFLEREVDAEGEGTAGVGRPEESEHPARSERLYNASALVGPQGLVGCYRKVHLPHLGVDRFVDRGNRPYRVYGAGEMRVGLAICYDSSFPEPMRVLGLDGADVIALATNWPAAAERTARIVPPARSMENHLYFVAANRIGRERSFTFCGLSSIYGPDGIELASAQDDSEQLLLADIDVALARTKRIERTVGSHVIDRFADRRPEFYGRVVQMVNDE